MRKIRKNDLVVVTAGKDKDRQGVVLEVIEKKGKSLRVRVEGVNIVKRHTKTTSPEKPGGILQKEASIDISNVALFNQATGKRDKVGFTVLADGRKIRVYKSTKEAVDL